MARDQCESRRFQLPGCAELTDRVKRASFTRVDLQFNLDEPVIAAPQTGRTRQRGPLALAFATSVAVSGGASLLYPVLPVLAVGLQVDPTRIGLAMAAFTAPAVVLAPLFGMIADLRGRRWILIFGLALFGVAGSAAGLAPSYSWLLALRALQGVGMSALSPLTIVLISASNASSPARALARTVRERAA